MIEALVAQLIDAGTPPAVAAAIVARAYVEGANSISRLADDGRSKEAIRQARYRERKASQTVSERNDITTVVTEHNAVMGDDVEQKEMLPTPLERKSPPLSKENPPKGGQKKGSRLPLDWRPSPASFIYGGGLGFIDNRIWDMAEDMRLWAASASGKNAIKIDWDSAFCGWMRREKAKQRDGPKRSGMDRIASIANGDLLGGRDERFDSPDEGQSASSPVQGSSGFAGRVSERDRGNGGPLLDLRPAGSERE